MKKIIYVFLLMFTIGGVYAQQTKTKSKESDSKSEEAKKSEVVSKDNNSKEPKAKKTPEEIANTVSIKMKENLQLSEEQAGKIKDITLSRVNSIRAAKAKSKEDKEAFKAARKEIMNTWMASLKEILTSEQYTKFQKALEERKKSKGENMDETDETE